MTIQPLLDVLTRIYDCQVMLLELAEKKKEVIIQDRTDDLSRITNQESKIVKQLAELDALRTAAIRDYMEAIGFKSNSGITLTELSKKIVNANDKSEMLALQSRLSDVTARLKQLNNINAGLIQSSLDYINFTLDLLTGTEADDMTYRNPADSKSAYKKNGLFDTKA